MIATRKVLAPYRSLCGIAVIHPVVCTRHEAGPLNERKHDSGPRPVSGFPAIRETPSGAWSTPAVANKKRTGHLIGSPDHHLHSAYIIRHNEVFGLDHEDTLLASLVARYHRGPAPSTEHADYRLLDRGQRLVVTKLAALLRVADSLDRGHAQPVHIRSTRQAGGELTLVLDGVKDTSPLQLAPNRKAGLFTSVFGLEVVLEVAPVATHHSA